MAATRLRGWTKQETEENNSIRLVSPKGNWNGNMKASDTAQHAPVIIGAGRVGRSIAAGAERAGSDVELRRRDDGLSKLAGRTVLLCVPDGEIGKVAAAIGATGESPFLIGHSSGATTLASLSAAGADGAFSVHPLQTIPDGETDLNGCPAAIAGTDPRALEVAGQIAAMTGMKSFEVSEDDRVIYHAAASIASNFLVTIEQTAAGLLGGIAVENPRQVLEPLVRRSLDNWLERGESALTGPIARGDEVTVEAHRRALSEARPDLVDFYDALADRTRAIANRDSAIPSGESVQ